MFEQPMSIGLATPNAQPDGWVYWDTVSTTDRMRQHARRVAGAPDLPARVDIVRSIPGAPDTDGLLARCDTTWPVSEEEMDAARNHLRMLGRGDSPESFDDDHVAAYVRGEDPHSDPAAQRAPLRWKAHTRIADVDADQMARALFTGVIRFAPEHPGWVAEIGSGATRRTLPGGALASPGEAFDRLVEYLPSYYAQEARALLLQAGGDIRYVKHRMPALEIQAIVVERDARQVPADRVLASASTRKIRWVREIPMGPAAAFESSVTYPDVRCPDCDATLEWEDRDTAICPGAENGHACGSRWSFVDHDGFLALARRNVDEQDQLLAPLDRSTFESLEAPVERIEQQHQARKSAAKSRRQLEADAARREFESYPEFAEMTEARGMRRGCEFTTPDGAVVSFFGPLRMDSRSGRPAAQVIVQEGGRRLESGRRYWLTPQDLLGRA